MKEHRKPIFPKGVDKFPDWREFECNEYTPQYLILQKRLAEKGLKDPWIRNWAWKTDVRKIGTPLEKLRLSFTGFGTGLMLFAAAVVYTEFFYHEEHHDRYPLSREITETNLNQK